MFTAVLDEKKGILKAIEVEVRSGGGDAKSEMQNDWSTRTHTLSQLYLLLKSSTRRLYTLQCGCASAVYVSARAGP